MDPVQPPPPAGKAPGSDPGQAGVFIFPASFVQRRLWFLEQWESGTAVYNTPVVYRLSGALDVAALGCSLNEIVRRHEALRTTFLSDEGEIQQRVSSELPLPVPVVDLENLANGDEVLDLLLTNEVRQAFDLEKGPLVRARLFRMAADEHVLALTLHHIVFDGWSEDVLFRELQALYEAFRHGRPSPLPALPIQYADYAVWLRERLTPEELARQLAYWQQTLRGLSVLDLPIDRPRPKMQTYRGAVRQVALPPGMTAALKGIGHRAKATLFMVAAAAFQTLLFKYSGQDDLSIGIMVSGRDRSELEGLIGCFVNTLVLRGDLSGNPTFHQLLARVREAALGAYAHRELPFERLVEALQGRDMSRSPLFQVLFNQGAARNETVLGNLAVKRVPVDLGVAKFDLTLSLSVDENAAGLNGWLEYNTDLFAAATIDRLVGHFLTLLEGIIESPDSRLSDLPLLTGGERRQALSGWNKTASWPPGACLHERFERQVACTPDAVALTCEEQRLTYAELNQRANRLAHHLRALGVVRDQLVGLRVERSADMVVGILGILKSGGAYLPLDPAYPRDRIAFMIEDSQVGVVVTQERFAADLDGIIVTRVLLEKPFAKNDTNPAPVATADSLAYVIYTSGSTGRPKGALITHYNVTRLFEATDDWYHFGQQDVWTLFHSYAFDFSVWELWGALLYGGRVVIVPYWVSRSPESFRELLARERVTVLNQTPSAFRQLIQADLSQPRAELKLRYVILGGEALELQSLRPWFARYGDGRPRLVNMYGITETTVHVTYRVIRQKDLESGQGSVIGCPIPDLQIYVLDPGGQPQPIGVPGEIYVGGAGVARGYLNRADLTAQRFIPDPFIASPGARLYRTGDLARRLANGDIEYVGRVDHQVKIRGFRVEPGEIEAGIARHPAVREVVVATRQDTPGDARLVAYVVSADPPPDLADQLRALIRSGMPEYMVPAHFVSLEALPLTENGKVDRRALPVPDLSQPVRRQALRLPDTAVEKALAGIWSALLGIAPIGADDDFFDMGGHSLLATQVVSRVRQALRVELPLRDIFTARTISRLAIRIEELQAVPLALPREKIEL